jgi:hypothetical protein
MSSTSLFANIIPASAIIVSALIAVAGWQVSAHKSRKQHRFQKRLDRRLAMFDDILAAIMPIIDFANSGNPLPDESIPELNERLSKAHLSIQLYGYKEERVLFEKIATCINQKDNEHFIGSMNSFTALLRKNLRAEMDYPRDEQS